ncbi:MAG: metallophosphoesterase family protein, partial [Methylococcaceae bacterium]|nr:metallophosphoesterase family protein [Methylococcaceae bacterium]
MQKKNKKNQLRPLLAKVSISTLFAISSNISAEIIHKPYLQQPTPSSIIVRWRTDDNYQGKVHFGSSPSTLDQVVSDIGSGTDHEVSLTGLSANTTYYYSVGNSTTVEAGGDTNHFFKTSPSIGSSESTRIWVLGDSGTASDDARSVRDAYVNNYSGTEKADMVLMLGDNVYGDSGYGAEEDYRAAIFDMYESVLRNTPLWPTIGNHDCGTVPYTEESYSYDHTSMTAVDCPYYDIFSLPKNGEVGGLASGTESYYSYNYNNIHFIVLDSEGSTDAGGSAAMNAMVSWLEEDISNSSQKWIIAFWHHPPYSKGSHDSDNDSKLTTMREKVLPILENNGVDLVLSGHSHSYERSYLLDGHYGYSDELDSNPSMKLDSGDGRPEGDGAYEKENAPHKGAVYVVAGNSGSVGSPEGTHNAMKVGPLVVLGSLVIDVNDNRLDVKFLRDN